MAQARYLRKLRLFILQIESLTIQAQKFSMEELAPFQ